MVDGRWCGAFQMGWAKWDGVQMGWGQMGWGKWDGAALLSKTFKKLAARNKKSPISYPQKQTLLD